MLFGTHKNHLNEVVLLGTQNICYKLWVSKKLHLEHIRWRAIANPHALKEI